MRISDRRSDGCSADLDAKHCYEVDLKLVGIRHKYPLERMETEAVDWQGALSCLAEDLTTRLVDRRRPVPPAQHAAQHLHPLPRHVPLFRSSPALPCPRPAPSRPWGASAIPLHMPSRNT